MNTAKDPRLQFHQEHREWLSQIDFHQDEIKFFQNELAMILHANFQNMSLLEHVEEYKSIFRKKLGQLDDLRHEIIRHEHQLVQVDIDKPGELHTHHQVKEQFENFLAAFQEMKANFKKIRRKK